MNWDDLQLEKAYNGRTAYGQSKLAQILHAFELAKRLDGSFFMTLINNQRFFFLSTFGQLIWKELGWLQCRYIQALLKQIYGAIEEKSLRFLISFSCQLSDR